MTIDTWTNVDAHLDALREPDPILADVLERSARAELPDISVSPEQGRVLTVFARSTGARNVLEIGTLGGYSAVCLARGLPDDGRVVALEFEPRHADVARESFARAGVDDRVELIEGPALDSLETLPAKHPAGFDLVFIDADKENYPAYWKWAVRLSHAGTLIIADNVVRDGELINRESDDPRVVAVREYLELVANDPRVTDATLQTVGAKGYDGLSLAVVH